MNITVAGTGYVGMSIATLLTQHNHVVAVDVIPEKVEKINNRISPIQDDYIEQYLAQKQLQLTATLDGAHVFKPGVSDKWYFVPLCSSCNSSENDKEMEVDTFLVPVPPECYELKED